MLKILVTGASGFIGKHFLEINEGKYKMQAFSLLTNSLDSVSLKGVDCILHLAGVAHQKSITSIESYRNVNTNLTKELATKAKQEGVQHFIFMSSVKVYGDSYSEAVLDINSPTNPTDAYGISKLEAEVELKKLSDDIFTTSIVRTPVVFGPRVKGNIHSLMKYASKGIPLPLNGITNKRSMVGINNLVSMLNKIIDSKVEGIFIAGDDKAISTSNLIDYISAGLEAKNRNFKLPILIRHIIKTIKPGLYKRVFQSFEIDNKDSLNRLKIKSQVSTKEGIALMAQWYKKNTQ